MLEQDQAQGPELLKGKQLPLVNNLRSLSFVIMTENQRANSTFIFKVFICIILSGKNN